MAGISAFVASHHSIVNPTVFQRNPRLLLSLRAQNFRFQARKGVFHTNGFSSSDQIGNRRMRVVRSSEEEGAPAAEAKAEEDASSSSSSSSSAAEQQTVSVPVSPSDTLTMFFQAEGTMSDAAIPAVTTALEATIFTAKEEEIVLTAWGGTSKSDLQLSSPYCEGAEGITTLKVQVVEGIASVELAKQTTIQATGVASSLVETIQNAGFKLQTLNLSFEEEEEVLV